VLNFIQKFFFKNVKEFHSRPQFQHKQKQWGAYSFSSLFILDVATSSLEPPIICIAKKSAIKR